MKEKKLAKERGLATVRRALELLDLFGQRTAWRLAEIARELELAPSVTHRLLTSLVSAGFLEKGPEKTYRLGLKVLALAARIEPVTWARERALPIMRHLVSVTNETCLLTIREGSRSVCIEKVDSSRGLRVTMSVGNSSPLHAGAASRLLLAYAPKEIVDQVLSAPLERYTPDTPTNPAVLREQIDLIRSRGYAISEGELDPGVIGIAAPVFNGGKVVACLCLASPVFRCNWEEKQHYTAQVTMAAKSISSPESPARSVFF